MNSAKRKRGKIKKNTEERGKIRGKQRLTGQTNCKKGKNCSKQGL
jgi:hypothetical protein